MYGIINKNAEAGESVNSIGINDIDIHYKRMCVEGLHLGDFQNMELIIYR